jgi:branched-chain amino acid aminotransferase
MSKLSEKVSLDWAKIGFKYRNTDFRFRAKWDNGQWDVGRLVEDSFIKLSEGAPALHYAQQCFEGMKAQTAKDGRILLFRPNLNAERMRRTAERLLMPPVPDGLFIEAVEQVVRANHRWVPPFGSGASLYIRPMLIGVGENLGLRPAEEYEFRVFCSPVGPYYSEGGLSSISLAVSQYDRAAPQGTGSYKAGANYAAGLLATKDAIALGADEALYLDSRDRRFIDEAGSANILVLIDGDTLVTPASNAILPSITRRSIMSLAETDLNLKVEERAIDLREEFESFVEMAACGTAAVLSPVKRVWFDDEWHDVGRSPETPIMQSLYDKLVGIQSGILCDPGHWVHPIAL